jgi:HNH endonuclease
MRTQKTIEERFWSKVDKISECWIWTGFVNRVPGRKRPYGMFRDQNGHNISVHRQVWIWKHGLIDQHTTVEQACGNPLCVRPEHLQVQTDADRFWSKVKKTNSCWLWIGNHYHGWYGRVRICGRSEGTHRAAWILTYGPVPDGMWVLHKCDNPLCVRPNHLFLGTSKDNVADCVAKDRQFRGKRDNAYLWKRGEDHHSHKLIEADVRELRRLWESGEVSNKTALARRFGVDPSTVRSVLNRTNWAHVK